MSASDNLNLAAGPSAVYAQTVATPFKDYARKAPAHRPRSAGTEPTPLDQQQRRLRRYAGYGFTLGADFSLAAEVEAVLAPIDRRAQSVMCGSGYSDGTRERVEHYVERIAAIVSEGTKSLATLLSLSVPPKLPPITADYLNLGTHTVASLLSERAALVTPKLAKVLSGYAPRDFLLAAETSVAAHAAMPDRLLPRLDGELRAFIPQLDRAVRSLRLYLDRLDKLAAPNPVAGVRR